MLRPSSVTSLNGWYAAAMGSARPRHAARARSSRGLTSVWQQGLDLGMVGNHVTVVADIHQVVGVQAVLLIDVGAFVNVF